MDVSDFDKNDLNTLLDKLSKKKKRSFFLGDRQRTNKSVDSLTSNSFIPYILEQNRVASYSKTLNDGILSNIIYHEVTSGNITAIIFDHLPQFFCY